MLGIARPLYSFGVDGNSWHEIRDEIAGRHKVKLIGPWSGAADHVFCMRAGANSSDDVDSFLSECVPCKQAFKQTPVCAADELLDIGGMLWPRRGHDGRGASGGYPRRWRL